MQVECFILTRLAAAANTAALTGQFAYLRDLMLKERWGFGGGTLIVIASLQARKERR